MVVTVTVTFGMAALSTPTTRPRMTSAFWAPADAVTKKTARRTRTHINLGLQNRTKSSACWGMRQQVNAPTMDNSGAKVVGFALEAARSRSPPVQKAFRRRSADTTTAGSFRQTTAGTAET